MKSNSIITLFASYLVFRSVQMRLCEVCGQNQLGLIKSQIGIWPTVPHADSLI